MLELIEQSRMAIDEMIDVMGRASIEAVLQLSAVQVAGPPQQGKARQPDIVWHGTQPGRVCLKERKLRVNKPRLRKKGRGADRFLLHPRGRVICLLQRWLVRAGLFFPRA